MKISTYEDYTIINQPVEFIYYTLLNNIVTWKAKFQLTFN